jgi:hypothetical protein
MTLRLVIREIKILWNATITENHDFCFVRIKKLEQLQLEAARIVTDLPIFTKT